MATIHIELGGQLVGIAGKREWIENADEATSVHDFLLAFCPKAKLQDDLIDADGKIITKTYLIALDDQQTHDLDRPIGEVRNIFIMSMLAGG